MNYDFLIQLEKQMFEPRIRRNIVALEAILHPDFFEFGASGKKWDRSETIESLIKEEITNLIASDFLVHPISQNVVLVTYSTELDGQKAIRSSIWKKSADAWNLFFHQGTKTA